MAWRCFRTERFVRRDSPVRFQAVAGQFARYKTEANYRPCMVIRNGFFSFRWSDIWDWIYPQEMARSPELKVIKAQPVEKGNRPGPVRFRRGIVKLPCEGLPYPHTTPHTTRPKDSAPLFLSLSDSSQKTLTKC